MSTQGTGTFQVKSWDETTLIEAPGSPKLTRASVAYGYQGAIEGEGKVEYLMVYLGDGTAKYVCMERVVGRIDDKSGSFVAQGGGTYSAAGAKVEWSVVPGSGTGDLVGLSGKCSYLAQGMQAEYKFEYGFE
jgi:hypothetical protein